ncbi:hypothetical protein, partial [Streptococcus pneumoniae]|uniref:hypothetical protein n=1 Tax=Streptococcus pneumoniae TaxID=1313 RepID=UPI000B02476E
MEWTTERRYRLYQDWTQEEIQHIKENMAQSPWHTHYHVEPKTGNQSNFYENVKDNEIKYFLTK